jgi:hypothetical protein
LKLAPLYAKCCLQAALYRLSFNRFIDNQIRQHKALLIKSYKAFTIRACPMEEYFDIGGGKVLSNTVKINKVTPLAKKLPGVHLHC